MPRKPRAAAAPTTSPERESRVMRLGDHEFLVPPLPLKISRHAYPIALAITRGDLIDRLVAATDTLPLDEADIDQLANLAWWGVVAAGSDMPREDFDALHIPLGHLVDAFFTMRFQTGMWVPAAAPAA